MQTHAHTGKFKVMSGRKFQYYRHGPMECYREQRLLRFAEIGLPLVIAPTIMLSFLILALAR